MVPDYRYTQLHTRRDDNTKLLFIIYNVVAIVPCFPIVRCFVSVILLFIILYSFIDSPR